MASIDAVDPVARTVLTIPLSKIHETRGLREYLAAGPTRDISICCLYQRARCRADSQCRQVHADRHLVAKLRAQADKANGCCAACRGTDAAAGGIKLTGRATAGMPVLPRSRIVPTICRVPTAGGVVEFEWANVCRLQLQDDCKYGDKCRNLHICPKLGKGLLARAAVNVNPHVPDSIWAAVKAFDAEFGDAAVSAPVDTAVPADEPSSKPAEPEADVAAEVPADAPRAMPVPKAMPLALRANFPRLNEESLTLKNADIDGLVFHLPTLASVSSGITDRFDLFSPSPAYRTTCSPTTPAPRSSGAMRS